MPSEPVWLPLEVVVEINRTLVAMTGEPHFVRDQGLLESALARPNGCELAIEDTETWADAVISLIEHRSTEEDFVRVIRPFVVPVG